MTRGSGKIFVNYRRDDDPGFTHALYQRLENDFSSDSVFMDVEGHIKPGSDFADVLSHHVAGCDVFLVVIGPRWAQLMAARAGDPTDFVGIEIQAALDQGKRVIPVLVGDAEMPQASQLPEGVRELVQRITKRQAVGLRRERFRADCQGLVTALKEIFAANDSVSVPDAEAKALATARTIQVSTEATAISPELASWQSVKDRTSAQKVRDHLARFPGGSTEPAARARLDRLVWSGLGSAPSVERLRAYLEEFPNGANAAQARGWIKNLQAVAEAERVAAERARQETEAWGYVAAATDPIKLQSFLQQWPRGQHKRAAEARLAELRDKAELKKARRPVLDLLLATIGPIAGIVGLITVVVVFMAFAGILVGTVKLLVH